MSKKILGSHFILATAILILCFVLFAGGLYRSGAARDWDAYQTEARSLAAGVEVGGVAYLERCQGVSQHGIALLHADGTILWNNPAGTSVPNTAIEAIGEAQRTGEGKSEIDTLTRKGVNLAIRLADGRILCVSGTRDSGWTLMMGLLFPFLVILAVAGLLSACLSSWVLRRMLEPVSATRLAQLEDLTELEKQGVCEELQPLLHRVAEQNRQAQRKLQKQMGEWKREYEKQDRMRRDFTANVSHELKTPLTSISGYAELLREGLVKPEDVSRFGGKIYEEARRLIALVGDILKLSQLEEGKQVRMDKTPIDLYQTCVRSIQSLQVAAEQRNITLSLTGIHLEIRGTEKVIDEIVYNLCDNAIKYNKVGGRVDISVLEEENQVVLRVRDSGIGIPPEEVERVFERFYCVDKSHSKEIGGTGLGLSIVKHGVAYHHAQLSLESRLGEGTEICIRFPQNGTEER